MVKKIILSILSVLALVGGSAFLAQAAVNCGQTFPASLNLYTSNCIIPSLWAQALEAKDGITGSNVTSSLDYQINHIFTSYGSEQVATSALTSLGNSAFLPTSTFLNAANNLSDIPSTSTARTNLGLGSAATLASSTWLKTANNLSDIPSTSTARTNLGLGTLSTQNVPAQGILSSNGTTISSVNSPLSTLNGGTATSTAPSDSQFLSANGTVPTWKTLVAGNNITLTTTTTSTAINVVTTVAAAGNNTYVQFNNGGTFGATSTFTFTSSSQQLGLNAASSSLIIGTQFATSSVTSTFSYIGASTTFTVPANVTSITITVNGAGGGQDGLGNVGSAGAVTAGKLAVTPGTVYYLLAAGAGGNGGNGSNPPGGTGGYANGSAGASCALHSDGGGGGSSWFSASSTFSTSTAFLSSSGGAGYSANCGGGSQGGTPTYLSSSLTATSTNATGGALASTNGTVVINYSVPDYLSATSTLYVGGHILTGGASPTIPNGTVAGNDEGAFITVSSSTTSYTLTFGQPWYTPPICGAFISNGTAAYFTQVRSTTSTLALTTNTALATGTIFEVMCPFGY